MEPYVRKKHRNLSAQEREPILALKPPLIGTHPGNPHNIAGGNNRHEISA
ncbi:hypothetical protein ACWDG1_49160 [Streptomyces sp. NPDC001177]